MLCILKNHAPFPLNYNILIIIATLEEERMEAIDSASILNDISKYEYNTLLKVISNYDLDFKSIVKEGKIYKAESSSGIKGLYKIKHRKDKLRNDFYITECLVENGFPNLIRYVKNAYDGLYTKYKSSYYYIKDWIYGRECDINNLDETLSCVVLLAKFHTSITGKEIDRFINRNSETTSLPSTYMKCCNELIRYKRIIANKSVKSDFDLKYGKAIDDFYKQGLLSINLLNKYDYNNMLQKAKKEKQICYGNFSCRNVIIDSSKSLYLFDFSNISADLRMNDLGRFIRKILSIEEYGWSFKIAQDLIKSYESIIAISKDELAVLFSIIIFPYRFYKLGNKYYESHKKFAIQKYSGKLMKLLAMLNKKQEFVKDFTSFYNINIVMNIK